MATTYTPQQLPLLQDATDNEAERVASVHDLTADRVERLKKIRPKRLGITCGRTDCPQDLHCFDDEPKTRVKFGKGKCRECGVDLIDWESMWSRQTLDVDAKFELLEKEWIRHFFFHLPITPRIEKYAYRHGREGLTQVIEQQLRQGKMLRFQRADWDRMQTKMLDGTIVHWARHAVACCCRQCMRYWHNVPLEHDLSDEDIAYFRALAMKYVILRLPDLKDKAA